MPSEVTRLSEFVRNNYKGINVLQNAGISYIRRLTGSDLRTLFLCINKQSQQKSPEAPTIRTPEKKERLDGDLNLTGSPLKDNFHIDIINMSLEMNVELLKLWTDVEEDYYGVGVDVARNVIMDIYENWQGNDECFWILCDKNDIDKTVLMEVKLDPQWSIRGSVIVKDSIRLEDVKIENLVKFHSNRIKGTSEFDTEIESTFYLKNNIQVKMFSNFHKQTPSLNHFYNDKMVLQQTINRKDSDLQASSFWCDILTLNHIKNHILEYQMSGKNEPKYVCGTDIKMRDLKDEISSLLTTVLFCNDLSDPECESLDLESVVSACKTRDYTDVTDSLWNLLKCCGSYQDLKSAFNFIFHFVQTNNIVNIPTNKSHLATLIREISEHRLTNLCLKETEPLELLLEIGIEKVEKDYEYIFVESKISNLNDLRACNEFYKKNVTMKADGLVRKSVFNANRQTRIDSSMASRTTLLTVKKDPNYVDNDDFHYSQFEENEIEVQICKLAHFHSVLEHLLLIKSVINNVDIYNTIIDHLLQQPMQFPFKVVQNQGFKKLDVELVNNSLMRIVKEKQPSIQRISFSSANSFKQVQTVFLLSIDPIFPTNVINTDENDIIDNEKATLYNNHLYLNVKTRK